MIAISAVVLLCSGAFAGMQNSSSLPAIPQASAPQASAPQAPAPQAPAPRAPAVHASSAAAPAAAPALGVSTYTISTLYTGDQVRDPFLPPSVGGGPARPRSRAVSTAVDIHALELHGIMKDAKSDFAIFSTDSGATLILRGSRLYDERNKRVPEITGRITMKLKRAELLGPDGEVQIYRLGDDDSKAKDKPSDEIEEKGSGRSP